MRGLGRFVGDLVPPGTAQATVVRSPVAAGSVVSVDATDARRAPGVLLVLTAADLQPVPEIPIRTTREPELLARCQPVLAVDRVRYVGEPLALVVAADRAAAEDAAELVTVRVTPAPPVLEPSPTAWDDGRSSLLVQLETAPPPAAGTAAAGGTTLTAQFAVARQTGAPLETRGVLAQWSPDGCLDLWGPTKYVHFTRRVVARALGVPEQQVVCHGVDVGGMFGVRGELYPEDVLVALAAKARGQPVAWVEDRLEHFSAINHARDQRHRVSVQVAADGRFGSFHDDLTHDFGAYPRPIGSRLLRQSLSYLPGPYRWSAVTGTARAVLTNKPPVGSMRAPSAVEATFARERSIDMLAAEIGADPVELRLRNLLGADDMPYRLELGGDAGVVTFDSGDFRALAEETLRRAAYPTLREQVRERRASGELAGLGVAMFTESSGSGLRESVQLDLLTDGTFLLRTAESEVGQGLDRTVATVVAQRLGFPARVRVWSGDTQAHDEGTGTFGSRSTIFVGSAACNAVTALLSQAREAAGEQLGVPPEELVLDSDGLRGAGELLTWKDLAPLNVRGEFANAGPTWGFGMHLAVVCVDPVTWAPRVERLVVGYDCGQAVDIANVGEQLLGGTVLGVGGALWEELRFDAAGRPAGAGLADYALPRAGDVPAPEVFAYQSGGVSSNLIGAKGVGEAGVVGAGAAVANALSQAVGVPRWPTTLPVRPADVWAALVQPAGRR